jgi:hypothetical protein
VFRTSLARDTVFGAANFAKEFEHLIEREVTIVEETKEGRCFFFRFNKTLLSSILHEFLREDGWLSRKMGG